MKTVLIQNLCCETPLTVIVVWFSHAQIPSYIIELESRYYITFRFVKKKFCTTKFKKGFLPWQTKDLFRKPDPLQFKPSQDDTNFDHTQRILYIQLCKMNVVPLINRITLRVEIIHLKSATIYLLKKTLSYGLAKLEVKKKATR